jgi:hypothetical protein
MRALYLDFGFRYNARRRVELIAPELDAPDTGRPADLQHADIAAAGVSLSNAPEVSTLAARAPAPEQVVQEQVRVVELNKIGRQIHDAAPAKVAPAQNEVARAGGLANPCPVVHLRSRAVRHAHNVNESGTSGKIAPQI